VVASLLAAIGIGPLLVDFVYKPTAKQHIHNPNWPPHAKFHDAQYIVMSLALGAIALIMVVKDRLITAAAILAVPWTSMFPALLFPGTASYDPEFKSETTFVLGMHGQLFEALITLVILVGAAFLAVRGRRRTS
jgi:hypothetical protein